MLNIALTGVTLERSAEKVKVDGKDFWKVTLAYYEIDYATETGVTYGKKIRNLGSVYIPAVEAAEQPDLSDLYARIDALEAELDKKQNKLIAGNNIVLTPKANGTKIDAISGPTLTAGHGIQITADGKINNLCSCEDTPAATYLVTVTTTPTNAIVKINGVEGNSRSFKEGDPVSIVVSAEGYQTQTLATFYMPAQDKSLTVNLVPIETTTQLCIKAYTPATANPTFTYIVNNGTPKPIFVGNCVTVNKGDSIEVLGVADGYEDYYHTQTVGDSRIELTPAFVALPPEEHHYYIQVRNITINGKAPSEYSDTALNSITAASLGLLVNGAAWDGSRKEVTDDVTSPTDLNIQATNEYAHHVEEWKSTVVDVSDLLEGTNYIDIELRRLVKVNFDYSSCGDYDVTVNTNYIDSMGSAHNEVNIAYIPQGATLNYTVFGPGIEEKSYTRIIEESDGYEVTINRCSDLVPTTECQFAVSPTELNFTAGGGNKNASVLSTCDD